MNHLHSWQGKKLADGTYLVASEAFVVPDEDPDVPDAEALEAQRRDWWANEQ